MSALALPEADALRSEAALTTLHMPGARRAWRPLAIEAGPTGPALTTYVALLLDEELQNRAENALRQRLRQARFPLTKTLDGFDVAAQPSVDKASVLALARGDFVRAHHNAVFVGGTGTGNTIPTYYPSGPNCSRG